MLNLKDLTNQMHIATNSSKFDISKEIDTAKIAKKVSKLIKVGDVLFFYGDIGVGKTTFIKYLINNLQKISKNSWRKGISIIHQNPYIFNASISIQPYETMRTVPPDSRAV